MRVSQTLPLRMVATVLFAGLTTLSIVAPARADFTFPTFNVTAFDLNAIGSVELVGAPAATYRSVLVTFDWLAGGGDPWSSEAIWALVDTPSSATGNTFYADPGAAPNSQDSADPVTLSWNAALDTPYQGGDPLHFWFGQTFDGSDATWNNITITLKSDTIPPPPSTTVANPSSTSFALSAGQVSWFSFDYTGGDLVLDTLGSSLTTDNDTELALYDAFGILVDTNDDIDFGGGNLLSRLSFANGVLGTGTYYVAVSGWNTTFSGGFSANSTSSFTGNAVLNISAGVVAGAAPEPSTLGLIALAALPLARLARRRRN
jgi:Bacterial pre-peptidase C-terminal domain